MFDINDPRLKQLIDTGYISVQKHPVADLYIYNYTHKCQFDKVWNELTMMCRGLIVDGSGKIVARPFKKFFNLEELEQIPDIEFQVHEKHDGSLGILYWRGDTACIATRGSFTSDQAVMATGMLNTTYKDMISSFDKSKTYLFEIIYPANRIVVDYGKDEKLILIAVIDTETGLDDNEAYHASPFERAKSYKFGLSAFDELKQDRENAEGFVIQFKDGMRCKLKHTEYVRLHRLLTGVNERRIWDILRTDGPDGVKVFLDRVPDEFYEWVRSVMSKLLGEYVDIERVADQKLWYCQKLPTRKEQALWLSGEDPNISSVVFAILDEKPYKHIIWKHLRPAAERPFKVEVE